MIEVLGKDIELVFYDGFSFHVNPGFQRDLVATDIKIAEVEPAAVGAQMELLGKGRERQQKYRQNCK
jgi:hypothetical protein